MFAPDTSDYVFSENAGPLLEVFEKCLPLGGVSDKAIPIEGTQVPGYSPIYRNAAFPKRLKKCFMKGLETVHEVFEDVASQRGDYNCFKFRPQDYKTNQPKDYETLTYKQVQKLKNDLGSGIIQHLKDNPYKDSGKYECHQKIDTHADNYREFDAYNHSFIVTLYSNNRYEWLLTDLACSSFSITSTALYDTLGANTSEFILELTQSPIVVCSLKHIRTIIALKEQYPEKLGHVISIVSMDPLFETDFPLRTLAAQHKIILNDIRQIIAVGEMFPLPCLPPSPKTLYTISFTSGTTGSMPKGVSLTHTASTASLTFYLSIAPVTPDSFAFLPFAHIFERETTLATIGSGCCVVFPQLNYSPLTLLDDLKLAKPTRVSLVPRVLNKFEAAIKASTIDNPNGSAMSKKIFNKVFNDKMQAQSQYDGADGRNFIYDKFIALKIKSKFGFDNLQVLIVGSAPIDPSTVQFLKASMQIGLAQGYGTTEVFAGFCISPTFEAKPGSTGPTTINTEVKLRELPDMNYTLGDEGGPRGELLVRGYQNFVEYYKNPEETAKALDSEGWFHTGDVAQISNETGRIYIIDRVKNFFKLAQGEFIAPESIENNYQSNNSILSQMFVHGDPMKNYLVGIVGIDRVNLCQFLTSKCNVTDNLAELDDEEVLKLANSKENKLILLTILNAGVSSLKGFQKVKNIHIDFEPLTLEKEVVTPTMKVKRPIAKKVFADILEALYQQGTLVSDAKL